MTRAGESYRLRTAWRDGVVVQAAWSSSTQHREAERVADRGPAWPSCVGLALQRGDRADRWPAGRSGRSPTRCARQRRFVADASHELRTPLTLLTTRAQLLGEGSAGATPTRMRMRRPRRWCVDADGSGTWCPTCSCRRRWTPTRARRERVDLRALADAAVAATSRTRRERGRDARRHRRRRRTARRDDDGTQVLGAGGCAAPGGRRAGRQRHRARARRGAREGRRWGGAVDSVLLRGERRRARHRPAVDGRLFERFAHAPGPAGSSRAGFGLGLALVQEVVQAHGGTVTGRTGDGGGAVFEVRLPAAPDPRESGAGQRQPGEQPGRLLHLAEVAEAVGALHQVTTQRWPRGPAAVPPRGSR